jgi:hypothetical protein
MSAPKWLSDYFGSEFDTLSPTVVVEGIRVAVVRITNVNLPKEFKAVGYILVKKNGRFDASTHISLHEGIANAFDWEKMVNRFNEEEAKI